MPRALGELLGMLEEEALARHPEVYSQQESVILQVPAVGELYWLTGTQVTNIAFSLWFFLLYFDVHLNTSFYA